MPVGLPADAKDPKLLAAVKLLGDLGVAEFQIRYDEEQDPIVWVAVGRWGATFEVAGGMTPISAITRLLGAVADGGLCTYCKRPTGITFEWEHDMPLSDIVCWWVYDPELEQFRRGCEAEHKAQQIKVVGRNDPCPCGSGEKFKKCHLPWMDQGKNKGES